MRVLIATPYLPWPLDSGGRAAQYSTLECLAEDHEFTLVCPVYDEAGATNARVLEARLPRLRVRAVDCFEPKVAPQRKREWIFRGAKWCVRAGRRVLAPMAPQAKLQETSEALDYQFGPLAPRYIETLHDELSKGIDLFQAEFAAMMPLGIWVPQEVPKLLIHHQINFVYAQRFLETQGRSSYANYLESLMRYQELAYLKSFDGVVVFSEDDRRALVPHVSEERLFTSPFPFSPDVDVSVKPEVQFSGRFVFVASEEQFPNRDGLQWLLEGVWPKIQEQLPSSKLDIVGRWSKAAQAKFEATGINFTGFVPDLHAVLDGSIMLTPLRIGSGIRVKILLAMGHGVPVVSTSVGCEGLPVTDGVDLLIRDEPQEFATAAVLLARNTSLRMQLCSGAQRLLAKFYSPDQVRLRRNGIYADVIQDTRKRQALVGDRDVVHRG